MSTIHLPPRLDLAPQNSSKGERRSRTRPSESISTRKRKKINLQKQDPVQFQSRLKYTIRHDLTAHGLQPSSHFSRNRKQTHSIFSTSRKLPYPHQSHHALAKRFSVSIQSARVSRDETRFPIGERKKKEGATTAFAKPTAFSRAGFYCLAKESHKFVEIECTHRCS